jgi:hypothetical protein
MFDSPNLPKIETPPGAMPVTNRPEIFTMPEKFRGLAGRVTPPQVKPAVAPPAPVAPPPPPQPLPKPITPPKPSTNKPKLSKTSKVLIISGGVLIATLLTAAIYVYIALQPVKQAAPIVPVQVTKPETKTPTAVTETPTEQQKEETPIEPTSPFPTGTSPGRDTDSDGLTDAEELLYHTNSKKPDSDSDGFLDGNEVFHGYDPNAPEPARLSESPLIGLYSVEGIYSLYYPLAWTAKEDAVTLGNVLFVVPSGEAISVSLENKLPEVTLADWFSGTSFAAGVTVTPGKTKAGYSMLETEDRMTVYVDAGGRVVILSYQNTVKATVDYLATFEMMMNTMILSEPYAESGVE